ncbi:MAG TPA: sulfur carrier protein ThiS [Euryarchaeota archaeon]|nr:sulfur carrier protein ThiS [Euryarchaeota archaeon]
MTITVNRRPAEHVEGETVGDLLKRMKYSFPLVVVKIDGRVIAKSAFSSTPIEDGSSVDVIHLTSGG